jgi:putative nucleotidyltransferase with HDIG domain
MAERIRILLINDDETTSRYLREKLTLEKGYSVYSESSSQRGLAILKQDGFDILIVKFDMPDLNGISLIKSLKTIDQNCIIITIMEEDNLGALGEISKLGVYDFITKSVNLEKLLFLIKNGVELRSFTMTHQKLTQSLQEQNVALQRQNILLAKRIEESTKNLTRLYEDLRSTYMRTIKALAHAIDARDHYTHSHSENVAKYAVVIAEEMGLSINDIETIREACELHDLGKIGIGDNILSKTASLTKEEWEKIKLHPSTAAQILEPLPFLSNVIDLVRQHHEHYDGTGYPEGRRGEEILLGARIIHLADAYDAMTSARSYREIPLSKEDTILEIKKNSGKQFDPKVVEAFLKVVDKI